MRKSPPKKTCFYIRISSAAKVEEVVVIREAMAGLGRVKDSGYGTAKDPQSVWFEVEVRDEYVESVRPTLHKICGVPHDLIAEAFPVDRGEGKLQAQQLSLV
jgi:hypothetical protein